MSWFRLFVITILLLPPCGCVINDAKTGLVADNPFGQSLPVQAPTQASYAAAPIMTAARVDQLGRRIVAANKQAGLRPLFRTIGAPQVEIFHRGKDEVDVTEGLVNQCTTDGQLAAVLCQELGKMVAERERLAGPQMRMPERKPPMDIPIGNDGGGSFGDADQVHRAELARFEKENPRRPAGAPPLDPQALARIYLTKAGFGAAELDGVTPILLTAAENNTFAKQITPSPQAQR